MSVGQIDPGQAVYAQDEVGSSHLSSCNRVLADLSRMVDHSSLFGMYPPFSCSIKCGR